MKRFNWCAVLMMSLWLAAGQALADDAPTAGTWYSIISKQSSMAIDSYGSDATNGAKVQQYPKSGKDNQLWRFDPVGDGTYYIVTKLPGNRALTVHSASKDNAVIVNLWDNVKADNQKWKMEATGDGFYRFIAQHSGKVLNVQTTTGTPGQGALLEQMTDSGANTSRWKLEPAGTALVEPRGQFVKLQSFNYPDRYLRHFLFEGNLTPVVNELDIKDSTFKLVPGLAGTGVSFESVNYPGQYLRHQLFRLKLQAQTPDELFRKDASFNVVPGLADAKWISLQSVNYPGRFLRHRLFQFWLDERGADDLYRKDATFKIIEVK